MTVMSACLWSKTASLLQGFKWCSLKDSVKNTQLCQYSSKKTLNFQQAMNKIKQDLEKIKKKEENEIKFRNEKLCAEKLMGYNVRKSDSQIPKNFVENQKIILEKEPSKTFNKVVDKNRQEISIPKSQPFAVLIEAISSIKKELAEALNPLTASAKLRRRTDTSGFKLDLPAKGMTLVDKKRELAESCRRVRYSHPYIEKLFDCIVLRNKLSETLTLLCKLDPTFTSEGFLKDCETDYVPNILQIILTGNLQLLKDWCAKPAYSQLAGAIEIQKSMGKQFCSELLSVEEVEIESGKLTEEGPILYVKFGAQLTQCMKDKAGNVIEGDPEKIVYVTHVWQMIRDIEEINPRAAWRLYDLTVHSNELLI